MKKESEEAAPDLDDMLPEYDFTGMKGVRGKYYRAYRRGHKVSVHESDGSTSVRYFKLEDGAVMLDPDIREHFPDSGALTLFQKAGHVEGELGICDLLGTADAPAPISRKGPPGCARARPTIPAGRAACRG